MPPKRVRSTPSTNSKGVRRQQAPENLSSQVGIPAENSSAPAPHPVPLEGIDIAALAAAVSKSVTEAVTTALQHLQSRPIATAPAPFALGSPSQDIQVGDSVRNGNATTTGEDSVTPRARAIPQGSTTEDVNNINSDFTSVVSGAAMNAATHMATGGFNSGDIAPPVSLACQPLYRRVSNDMRDKIISGKFIDLASLLDNSGEQESYLRLDKSGFVQLPQSRKRFLDINKWTDAFSIYASVLRQHNPNLREPLATYQNVVRGIASNGGHWYFYDTNFRRMRESSPDLAWNQLVNELYIQALTKRAGAGNQNRRFQNKSRSPFRSPQQHIPKTCHTYNKGRPCEGCAYKHVCSHCGQQHQRVKCKKWLESKPKTNDRQ
ncbi:uncharacterized protein [Argopecten irradians]|uniref:uncharacterized protein n=1 Tax=Argopecten irradians TaxID=31199 RepID=UPI003721BAB4